jgi:hypothetical protein
MAMRHDREAGYSPRSEPFIFVYDIIPRVQNPNDSPFFIKLQSQVAKNPFVYKASHLGIH